MIRFSLRCDNGHEFESWFKDGAAYDRMAAAGLVECPVCGDTRVAKALMTPAIAKVRGAKGRPEAPPPAAAATPTARAAAGPLPAQVLALLQRMRAEIERSCDYVGADFAEEARRIHYGEAEARGIYGEASEEEAEALREEGIEVARLPWVPRSDG
ncbi:DUF1178 family protein [Rubritepida flocculans]|uniref:DUF1178 family protein n=1 Tax=Rubritepida flocculans TaxID=182403 RepID=UPI00041EE4CC|nr:DUF1178 family protein [Rubritepida flocculans]